MDLDGGILAVYASDISNGMAPGAFLYGENKSVVVGFALEDVDRQYDRLVEKGVSCVKARETYEWGTRSACFRDPGGGIVDLLTVV